jgi:hypothetical protein
MAEGLLGQQSFEGYGETADKLREAAGTAVLPNYRAELLKVAASFDRLARRMGERSEPVGIRRE